MRFCGLKLRVGRGEERVVRFPTPGRYPVTLTVFDAEGARSTVRRELAVETEEQRLARKATPPWKIAAVAVGIVALVAVLLLLARPRKEA